MKAMRIVPGVVLVAAGCLAARALADLAASSPFLPKGSSGAVAGAAASGPLELRGVMASTAGSSYCIYDVAKKRDFWVGLNEPGLDFTVKSADPEGNSVTVDYQGRLLKLDFHSSKVASSGSGSSSSTPAAAPVGPPVVLNPTPADEQKRLDAVAQEVRRRRLERERAAAQGGQPPAIPGR